MPGTDLRTQLQRLFEDKREVMIGTADGSVFKGTIYRPVYPGDECLAMSLTAPAEGPAAGHVQDTFILAVHNICWLDTVPGA